MSDPLRIGILISGRGSNMLSIVRAFKAGELPGVEVACVIADKPQAPGLARAEQEGVPTRAVPRTKGEERSTHEQRILEVLREHGVELVCLAGYMRILTGTFISAYENRILNIHPSLLPSFPGIDAQAQALEYGVKVSGVSVHFVTEAMDAGPIIAQTPVPVLDGDTPDSLAARILEQEHRIYPEAIRLYAAGRLSIDGRQVRISPPPGD